MDTEPDHKLVVGLSLDALFAVDDAGPAPHGNTIRPLQPGPAMPLVRRLLGINERAGKRLVEVVVASQAGHRTALQVMTSAKKHDLEVVGWAFTDGRPVWPYLDSLQCNLFLSTSTDAIVAAVDRNVAAARILPVDEEPDGATNGEVRILLDGDAVLFDPGSQQIYENQGLAAFVANEARHADTSLTPGPRASFFAAVGRINRTFPAGERPIRLSLLTGRNSVAHERIVAVLDEHGVGLSETVLVGGLDKSAIIDILRPHIHFDEHTRHLTPDQGRRSSSGERSSPAGPSSTTGELESPAGPSAQQEPPPPVSPADSLQSAGSGEPADSTPAGFGGAASPGLVRATTKPNEPFDDGSDDVGGPPPPPTPAPVLRTESAAPTDRAREHSPASIAPAPTQAPSTSPSGFIAARHARRSDGDGDERGGGDDGDPGGVEPNARQSGSNADGEDTATTEGGTVPADTTDVVVIDGIGGNGESDDEADSGESAGEAAASGRRGLFRRGR